MSKRPADIIISTPASKVRRRLNFGSPYACRAAAPIVRVTKGAAQRHRQRYRWPKLQVLLELDRKKKEKKEKYREPVAPERFCLDLHLNYEIVVQNL
nr:coat protein (truncated) [Cotton leaf curl Burewala virus]